MKKKSLLFLLFCLALALFFGCKKDEEEPPKDNILPANMTIDIPESISNSSGGQKCTSEDIEPICGDSIYEMLRVFIYIGEASADLINEIATALNQYNINQAMSDSYISDEDGRTKNFVVVENVTYNSVNWEFELTIADNESGGKALQLLWNNTSPVKVIAILNPHNCNYNDNAPSDLMYKVEYSEVGDMGYEKHMIVSITNAPMEDTFSIDNLKMFVGKTGDIIDVFGNSNHPNAVLIDPNYTGGFNWAFVARGDDVKDIGVAKVGLPPCIYEYNSADSIFDPGPYSIFNVLKREIKAYWKDSVDVTDQSVLDSLINIYIQNTQAPAYFNDNGFISCGTNIPTNPAGFTTEFIDLSGLTPYKPKDINDLVIEFY